MKKVDVSFRFLNNDDYGFAKIRLKTGAYEENFYSVDEIIQFMITSINSNQIRKGKKYDLGKNSDAIYVFKYVADKTKKEDSFKEVFDIRTTDNHRKEYAETENVINKEAISIRIPGNCRKEYIEKEKALDSLLSIRCKLNRAALAKTTALVVAGVTLATFATVKLARVVDYELQTESSKVQAYVQSLEKSPHVEEYDRLCYEIEELEKNINSGHIPDVALEQNIEKLESMKNAKAALEASFEQNQQSSTKSR